MGLIKWLFGMNLSEEDIEHNRRIDERERFEREAEKWVKINYPKWYVGSPKWEGTIMEAVKLYKDHLIKENKERLKADNWYKNYEEKEHQKRINFIESNENNAKFKVISMKQKQNIPLTKEEIEFMNNHNGKIENSDIVINSNNQNKSNLELELEIKQKELELLKLRAQMEKEKN